jgi:uncharacterized protein YxjI
MVRRKVLTLFGAKFHVYDAQGNMILFSRQKAFKLKEDIRVYTDESMSKEMLTIKARKIIDFSSAYDVVDAQENKKVGALRRKGWSSMVRDSWEFLDENDNSLAFLKEDSMALALVRRFLTNLIPQTYYVRQGEAETETSLVCYKQNFNPFVFKLNVSITEEGKKILDPRLILAAGILLVAVEGRQQ